MNVDHLIVTGDVTFSGEPPEFDRAADLLRPFAAAGLVGVALAAGNAESTRGRLVWGLALLLAIVFFAVYLPRKFAREYPRLRRLFGEDLDRHAEHVPNFWPRLSTWRSGDTRCFSFQRVTANREWPWGLVLAGVLAAIWFAHAWSPLERVFAGGG